MLKPDKQKRGEYNVYTLIRRYVELTNAINDSSKNISQVMKEMGYNRDYYTRTKYEMKKRGLLENFPDGPHRASVSSTNKLILPKEELFDYEDSVKLFEDRFDCCLGNMKKAQNQDNKLKILWDMSKALFIFEYGQQFRYRFVLMQSSVVFSRLIGNESLKNFYRYTREAIANKIPFSSLPDFVHIIDINQGFLKYDQGDWLINTRRLNSANNRLKKPFLGRYARSNANIKFLDK